MYRIVRKSVNALQSLGLMAIMFALVASMAGAPAASAASLSTSDGTPINDVAVGKVIVKVTFSQPLTSDPVATVAFYDEAGVGVAKVQTSGGVAEVKLPAGVYTMYVSAKSYDETKQVVKVAANETSYESVMLTRSTARAK